MNTENQNHKAAKELADSLNGIDNAKDFKLITLTIQDVNPISFTEQCENYLKEIPGEALQFYGINCVPMDTPRGKALVYIANIQFWSDENSHKEWIAEIKRANLLIKP